MWKSCQGVPTTNRSWQWARAVAGMALTGAWGVPEVNASTSRALAAMTRSAGVSPGSPQSGSMSGSVGPPPGVTCDSAWRTVCGMVGARSAGTVMTPRWSTMLASALASTVAGLRSSPPQLPEW